MIDFVSCWFTTPLLRADLTEHVFGDKLFLCCNPAAMSARMLDDEKTVSRTKSGTPFFQLVVDKA
jgi:hypothetical protein